MTIREANEADLPELRELLSAFHEEFRQRPFAPPPIQDDWFGEGRVLIAERDGQTVGLAKGLLQGEAGHVSLVYLRPDARRQGAGKELLRELAAFFRELGVEHVTLGVNLPNDDALAVWRRLGFTESRREFTAELGALDKRLGEGRAASFGSVHVQTDDQGATERAVARFVPRLFRSSGTVVSAPQNGWIAVYDGTASMEPSLLPRLAAELSNITGGVVVSLAVEEGAVVRLAVFERGRLMDEYLSVPEYYGPLPPGDVAALRANPTLLARLTGADAATVRAVARTAASPGELPPAVELSAELAAALGIDGAGLDAEEARSLEGAVTVTHD